MLTYRNISALVLFASITGCKKTSDTAFLSTYATNASAAYADSLAAGEALDAAITTFVADPSEDTLAAAKTAWLDSREPYLQTEVYRFYDGPIDNAETGPEGLLNAWPLDEAYIDYVEGTDEDDSIINDTSITIDAETLESLNEAGGEANIATGYHAIEFLLWGQDQSEDGPGDRPYTDYTDADNADRRGLYLTTVSSMLVGHLGDLNDAWVDGDDGNYRAEFVGLDRDEGLRRILTGMIILSGFETGGERLQTALDSGDQEDEHSCFSDNTHRDMIQDVQGVSNVWNGSYGSLSGDSVKDVIAEDNADLADTLTSQIETSLAAGNAMETPFDNAIALDNDSGRESVSTLVSALREQESILEDIFRALSLDVPEAE